MKDFYKLLYGLLNPRRISIILRSYLEETIYDPDDNIVSVTREINCKDLSCTMIYSMLRNNLTEEQWNRLLIILRGGRYKTIISEFIDEFSVTDELAEILNYSHEISKEEFLLLKEQKEDIKIAFLFDVVQAGDYMEVHLCETTMPLPIHTVLFPCIVALINTYYDALVHFIVRASSLSSEVSVHYLTGCCSPWLEEIYDVAFKDVFGEDADKRCCYSDDRIEDTELGKTILLKTVGDRINKPETRGQLIDDSIMIIDSQSEEIRSVAKNRLFFWSNLVGDLATVPQEIKATRALYVDSCYGYSFESDLFLEGRALYNASDSMDEFYRKILSKYERDYLQVPFHTVPRVRVRNAQDLFDVLYLMRNEVVAFRGQTSEYYLNRSPELMIKLYGKENAKEPSLASFALRSGDYFENHYTEWALLIKEYLALSTRLGKPFEQISRIDVADFYMFCLAVAQHYGLPTFGLDVSYSVSTALFFSMFEYHPKTSANGKSQYIRKESGESIIYLFKPKRHEVYDYSGFSIFREEANMFFRPVAQQASFVHSSWGMARNSIAERLLMAISFDVQDIDFEEINNLLRKRYCPSLSVNNFFPKNDPFIDFLQSKYLSVYRSMDNYPHVVEFMEYLKKYIYQLE